MHPILAKIGPVTLYAYGATLALAFLLAVALASHATRHSLRNLVPLTEPLLIDWGCWTILGGILGGRLLYVVLNWDAYRSQPLEMVAIWHGGLVWYGGLVGGVAAQWIYFKTKGIAFLQGTDQVIPFVALGHAVGRIGCFANGCCAGIPTSSWFAVRFPDSPQPVVPTQLLESASLIVLYLLLRGLQTPAMLRRPGALFGLYLVGYAVIRWTLEFWRANQPMVWNGWTLHQLISLVVFVIGVGLLVVRFLMARAGSVSGDVAK